MAHLKNKGEAKLAKEKSPYLLQHAENPVNWYPWGREAFEDAKASDIPVFLSIGYSSCHWCHRMREESFEDKEVAELLNSFFIPVKVDREERPDIDQFYMNACQAMTGQGGWPLTVILTPDGKPFFAGTYFPKKTSRGMPGLMEVLRHISELWKEDREKAVNVGEELYTMLQKKKSPGEKAEEETEEQGLGGEILLDEAYNNLWHQYDEYHGGFGGAPKFPAPHQLIFLLRYQARSGEKEAGKMALETLRSMSRGGIFDQLGYGFHRYSTDARWMVPHFEKMLYDQATTALVCLETFLATGEEEVAGVAKKVFTYVLRDLTSPEGGFYSAEDADTEGEEGKYYVWSPKEIIEVMGEERGEVAKTFYGVEERGNFEGGRSVLSRPLEIVELAQTLGIDAEELSRTMEECREKLLQAREKRERPFRDDKIITSWNGMMIAALARGAQYLENPVYTEAAQKAGEFIINNMFREGRLMRRYREGEAAVPAFLEDYACLGWGFLELYRATLHEEWLQESCRLGREMVELFMEEDGVLRFVGNDQEREISPAAEAYDGAHPSGVSVAADLFLMLGRTLRDEDLEEKGRQVLGAYRSQISRAPHGFTHLLSALDLALSPPEELVIAGERDSKEVKEMVRTAIKAYRPRLTLLFRPKEIPQDAPLLKLAPFLNEMAPLDNYTTAYYCSNYHCYSPTKDPSELKDYLKKFKFKS